MSLTAISNYARQYAKTPNTAYRWMSGNDCANFVSQALLSGGWSMAGSIGSDVNNQLAWWYSTELGQSLTWVNASALKYFAWNTSPYRTDEAQYFDQMIVGDIMFADWTGDGSIDHSMVVTKKVGTEIFLSYHTDNTLDLSITSLVYDSSRIVLYGLFVLSSY